MLDILVTFHNFLAVSGLLIIKILFVLIELSFVLIAIVSAVFGGYVAFKISGILNKLFGLIVFWFAAFICLSLAVVINSINIDILFNI